MTMEEVKKQDIVELEKLLRTDPCAEDREYITHKIDVLNGRLDFHEDRSRN